MEVLPHSFCAFIGALCRPPRPLRSSLTLLLTLSGSSPSPPDCIFAPDAISQRRERRTTLMIRNIPNKYTQAMLLEEIDRVYCKD